VESTAKIIRQLKKSSGMLFDAFFVHFGIWSMRDDGNRRSFSQHLESLLHELAAHNPSARTVFYTQPWPVPWLKPSEWREKQSPCEVAKLNRMSLATLARWPNVEVLDVFEMTRAAQHHTEEGTHMDLFVLTAVGASALEAATLSRPIRSNVHERGLAPEQSTTKYTLSILEASAPSAGLLSSMCAAQQP